MPLFTVQLKNYQEEMNVLISDMTQVPEQLAIRAMCKGRCWGHHKEGLGSHSQLHTSAWNPFCALG